MKVFQPVATGQYKHFSGRGTIHSGKVFLDRVNAERYAERFKRICSESPDEDARSLRDLNPDTIVVHILELEVCDE